MKPSIIHALLRMVMLISVSLALGACGAVTLGQRAFEDRSVEDITADTELFARLSAVMANNKTIAVTSIVYEQEVVMYGLMDDKRAMDRLAADIRNVEGLKKLHWHVTYMSEADQSAQEDELLGITGTTKAKAAIEAGWLTADAINSLNFRIGVDDLGSAFLMGRAKTRAEKNGVLAVTQDTEGIKRITEYIKIIP